MKCLRTDCLLLVSLLAICLPLMCRGGELGLSQATSIEDFLTSEGKFDIDAARQAGFEGNLDLSGFAPQFDPGSLEPVFSPLPQGRSDDDANWQSGFGLSGPSWPDVKAVAIYDGKLFAAGGWITAGDVVANGVAQWDGESWSALDGGLGSLDGCGPSARTLAVYGDRLVVGGYFDMAGGQEMHNVAAWDGSQWHPLGSGIDDHQCEVDDVIALAAYNGDLYAGGYFTYVNGIEVNHIARWDGSDWNAVGSGADDYLESFLVFEDRLVAGGRFLSIDGVPAKGIAWTDGESWEAMGEGFAGQGGSRPDVEGLTVFNDRLVAGGGFLMSGTVPVRNLGVWTGTSWEEVGGGVTGGGVWGLAVYQDKLIVGGTFENAGGNPIPDIAAWDGTSWSELGGRLVGHVFEPYVLCAGHYDGKLIVGGSFDRAGDVVAYRIVQWDGTSWEALGSGKGADLDVRALAMHNGDLIAGGDFWQVGDAVANYIARWDGASWHPLGGGTNATVLALASYDGDLIVGGEFTSAGGEPVDYVARWNGAEWLPVGGGINGVVNALCSHGDHLYAGGEFTHAGSGEAGHVAHWDRLTWHALDSGLNGKVNALASYAGGVVAGGQFTQAGGVSAKGVALWDGQTWRPLGSGTNSSVVALTVWNGDLIVGGNFLQAGGMVVNFIARWDGSTWHGLDSGVSEGYYDTGVQALTTYNGDLIAAGDFAFAGGTLVNDVARWNGTEWDNLGSGIPDPAEVYALASSAEDLFVGGHYWIAGDNKASHYIAVWSEGASYAPDAGWPNTQTTLCLANVQPNPTHADANVAYFLPASAPVRLTIHDVLGRRVATLAEGIGEPGWHEVVWGRSHHGGHRIPPGVYFIRLESLNRSRTARIVLTR